MAYILSELVSGIASDFSDIVFAGEKPFNRLSRITSLKEDASCVYLGDRKYLRKMNSMISMVITTPEIGREINTDAYGVCMCSDPKRLYFRLLDHLNRLPPLNQVENRIGKNCYISETAVLYDHDVVIGNDVTVEEFAVIYPNTTIGDHCIIRAGAKVGIQDYNYYSEDSGLVHVFHAGGVAVHESAEIGYNSVVGRGLYAGDETVIGKNAKISHNVCIGHDVQLGKNTMIYSGAVIGGYTVVEDGAHITMNATVKNGIRIGKDAMVCMGSNVILNVSDGKKVFGNPAKVVTFG